MKDYDAYLFDWDGTVTDTLGVWLKIFRTTLNRYGIQATDKALVRGVAGRARAGLIELGVPEHDLPNVFAEWDKTAGEQLPLAPFYPGVGTVLSLLKSRVKKMGLVTATVRPTMQKTIAAHGLSSTFDVVVTGDEVQEHKPDPEGILYTLEKLGVAKDRAVMLGDSEKDMQAAHNAGIDSVLFYPPEHKLLYTFAELQSTNPTYIIRSWEEMLDQLQQEAA